MSSAAVGRLEVCSGLAPLEVPPVPTNDAYNVWWLDRGPGGAPAIRSTAAVGCLPRRVIGLAAFARTAYAACACLDVAARGPREWAAAAAAVYASFFMLPTQIHERHLLPFFPSWWLRSYIIAACSPGLWAGASRSRPICCIPVAWWGYPAESVFGSVLGILTPDRIAGINVVLWATLLIVLWWLPSSRSGQPSTTPPQDKPAAASP